jgi:hypothetical protein
MRQWAEAKRILCCSLIFVLDSPFLDDSGRVVGKPESIQLTSLPDILASDCLLFARLAGGGSDVAVWRLPACGRVPRGSQCTRKVCSAINSFLVRSLRYLNEGILSPFQLRQEGEAGVASVLCGEKLLTAECVEKCEREHRHNLARSMVRRSEFCV